MRLLLDEMYAPALAGLIRSEGIDATSIVETGRSGTPDAEVFSIALAEDRVLLTENVADFVQIASAHSSTGLRHPGVLIALSSRFSRRPAGFASLVAAIAAVRDDALVDRIVYLSPIAG